MFYSFESLTLLWQLAGGTVTMQGPPGPPGPPGPKGEVKNLPSFFAGGLTWLCRVGTKGWSSLLLWELQLFPPLPFQAQQNRGN